ncbi:non-canonical purine NTP pyrophosphatase [Gemmatimonas sp.]
MRGSSDIATAVSVPFEPSPRTIVMATRSEGKLRELAPLLASHGWQAVTLDTVGVVRCDDEEEALEVHDTFEANALAKARYFAKRTGLVVVADDSGLVVEALGGQPGVRSKRWSGSVLEGAALDAHNNHYLQARLAEAAREGRGSRQAAYVCAAACVWAGGELVATGRTEGRLLAHPEGAGGFGYDPYFWSDDLSASFASVSREAKAAVSHRGRAFAALFNELESFFALPVDPAGQSG